jgi:hypothetical protein
MNGTVAVLCFDEIEAQVFKEDASLLDVLNSNYKYVGRFSLL